MIRRIKLFFLVIIFISSSVLSWLSIGSQQVVEAASYFEDAYYFTRFQEGGYVNHPADLGGATNYGVTQRTYNTYRTNLGLPLKEVKDISLDEVRAIYEIYYHEVKAERMERPLAIVMFDTYFMMGHGSLSPTSAGATEFLQMALQKELGNGLIADGIWGPQTEKAFNAYPREKHYELALKVIQLRRQWHYIRVQQNPSQEVFLQGWLNRANALEAYISSTISENPLLKLGDSGPYVVKLQTILKEKGFDVGGVDGYFGNQTKTAVIKFQQANLIGADGIVGQRTWEKLLQKTQYSLIEIQLNGKEFTPGYFKDGTTYVHWKALEKFKIPYTYHGNARFTIEGRAVQGEYINNALYIRWNKLSPGNVSYEKIEGGYNFIYPLKIKVQLNGKEFTPGYFKDGTTYVHWKALEKFKIPYTYHGNARFTIEGRKVQGEYINNALYIRWNKLSPGNVSYEKIEGGYNFNYPPNIKVQLNGKEFTPGYFKDGTTYVHWKALEKLKIPYTYHGNAQFTIEGRKVQGEYINNALYIRWNKLSPGNVSYEKIEGGYNFIYPPTINVQLNGKEFTPGYFKDGTTYVHWKALEKFKIPYTYHGNAQFTIEGRKVQGEYINNALYIRWNKLSPGKVRYEKIKGGYNFIYPPTIKVQLNGKEFTPGYFKDGTTYVHWKALEKFKIPYKYYGNAQFTIEGRAVQGEYINGALYIRWYWLSPGNITYTKITGGYNFTYKR
ncbi:glycosyl hydrolase 108 family protein [Neobacillus thermocopriae]|uniref:glycosyl hydrolase 108 family protein n=1 Tax=Neobacillus thermocopriae TaxID=1215031 RepID=UPI00376FBE9E